MAYYYNIDDDLNQYPDAWCYIIIGGRNVGKTYSTLKSYYMDEKKFAFLKRTIEDVELITAGGTGVDLSPFKSINRDTSANVYAKKIFKGLGGFWDTDEEGNVYGVPIGYIIALNAVSKIKGFDLSECEALIFDEFIPQPWERVNRKEGEQLMDLYKTIARDREHRGREALKLICLANATNINNPVMEILEIVDIVANMQALNESHHYIEDRGILIHMINDNDEFRQTESESAIYKAMAGTRWADMALGNQFGYNDFSAVGHVSLKNYVPVCSVQHKQKVYYIYRNANKYYMCNSRHTSDEFYNLNKENDQKLFFTERCIDLREACIESRMLFQTYSMYDLIVNYKTFFKL